MNPLNLKLIEFLDEVADRTPTPGGGGVTAAAGALACAMARMVAAYSVRKKTDPDTRERVQETMVRFKRADHMMRGLIAEDAAAYTHMTDKALYPDRSCTDKAYAQAVTLAIAVPMKMAAVASTVLADMDHFKTVASPFLLSDLGVAAVLAAATAHAARYSVRVNATQLEDDDARARVLADIDATVEHCDRARAAIEEFVAAKMTG